VSIADIQPAEVLLEVNSDKPTEALNADMNTSIDVLFGIFEKI